MLTGEHLRSENGFTLVELMVATILLALIGVAVTTALVGVFHSSGRTHTRERAMQAAVHATDTLQDDLRAAHARYRDTAHVRSIDDLRGVLLFGETPNDSTVAGGVLDMHDITRATATDLVFESDVMTEASGVTPVPECVRWTIDPSGALVREIYSWSFQCLALAAPISTAVMMQPNGQTGYVPKPFSFIMLRQTQNPLNANVDVDPSKCITTPPVSATLNQLQRDQTTAVRIDLSSFLVERGARGDQRLQSTVTVAARQGYDYRFALGCTA